MSAPRGEQDRERVEAEEPCYNLEREWCRGCTARAARALSCVSHATLGLKLGTARFFGWPEAPLLRISNIGCMAQERLEEHGVGAGACAGAGSERADYVFVERVIFRRSFSWRHAPQRLEHWHARGSVDHLAIRSRESVVGLESEQLSVARALSRYADAVNVFSIRVKRKIV